MVRKTHLELVGHKEQIHAPWAGKLPAILPPDLDVTPADADEDGQEVVRLVMLGRVGEWSVALGASPGVLQNPPDHDLPRNRKARMLYEEMREDVAGGGDAFWTTKRFRHLNGGVWRKCEGAQVERGGEAVERGVVGSRNGWTSVATVEIRLPVAETNRFRTKTNRK